MYKVFIDHKPIIIIHKNDLSTGNLQFESKNVGQISDLKELLSIAEIDNPLFLISEDSTSEFNRLFADYKYLEAAGGIVEREGLYLVIKRMGFWDIPKGKIEKNESPEEACVREIMEECGIEGHSITAPLLNTFHTMKWEGRPALKKTYWYMLKYTGSEDGSPQEEEQITEVVWMNHEELLGIRSNTFGSINDVLDAFDNHLSSF